VPQRGQVPVLMGLQGEDGLSKKKNKEKRDHPFCQQQVNPTTGTHLVSRRTCHQAGGRFSTVISWHVCPYAIPSGQPFVSVCLSNSPWCPIKGLSMCMSSYAENNTQYRRVQTSLESDGFARHSLRP